MKSKYLKYWLICFPILGFSQMPISLEQAYRKAYQNNLSLKSGQLRIDFQDRIKKSYAYIDPLVISAEVGQINSAYMDNRLSAIQTLRLPKFYSSQKLILEEEWKNAELSLEVQKWQLKRELALVYNNLNYLDEKQKLLKKTDSIYSNYYKRADLRLKKGESNILEKTTAETYRSQAEIQLRNLLKDREVLQYQFNYLINDSENYTNEQNSFYQINLNFDDNFQGNALVLKQLEQEKNIAKARLEAEKAKLLPSFTVGINSMTMKGTGADDLVYNGTHRFQSGVVGVALPIFNSAQKSLIEGQKINQQIAESNYNMAVQNFRNQYIKTFGEYEKLKSEVEYYETKGLKNAESIMFTANLLLKEGETNYLEYTILVNQSLDIQNRYVDAKKMLNEKIIELNHLKEGV